MLKIPEGGLFVWRGSTYEKWDESVDYPGWEAANHPISKDRNLKPEYNERQSTCPYCGEVLSYFHEQSNGGGEGFYECPLCGWATHNYGDHNFRTDGRNELRYFELDDPKLLFEELGQLFLDNKNALYDLSPRRFEELISDMFKNHGFATELTKASRDGGYDVMLFDNNGQKTIVEVKRYKGKVGVDVVRKLRGVHLTKGVQRAKLVTSSSFTSPAITEADSAQAKNYGFELDLVDLDELLRLLEVYRNSEFSLPKFDEFRALI